MNKAKPPENVVTHIAALPKVIPNTNEVPDTKSKIGRKVGQSSA